MSKQDNVMIAKRYALALYRSAAVEGAAAIADALIDWDAIITSAATAPLWHRLTTSPLATMDNKKNVVKKIIASQKITDSKAAALLERFLILLVQKGRLSLLAAIIDSYRGLLARDSGLLQVAVTTAQALSAPQQQSVNKQLLETLPRLLAGMVEQGMGTATGELAAEKKLDRKLEISYKVDQSLIGGMTVMVESYKIDISIKNKLARLASQLTR